MFATMKEMMGWGHRTSSSPTGSRVSRTGTQLYLGGNPFRMIGFDLAFAAVTSWNHPACYQSYEPATGTNLATDLADIQAGCPGLNTLRVWFFQQFANDGGVRNWTPFNTVLTECNAAGVKVIACLCDNWSYEFTDTQGSGLSASWFSTGYTNTYTTPWETEPYRAWVQEVVTQYAGDARILAWELGNELGGITTAFATDVAGLIKSIDPGALVSDGCGGGAPVIGVATTDLASYHYYTDYSQTNWQGTLATCVAAGKPSYIGEGGFDTSLGLSTRASDFSSLFSSVFAASGEVGFVVWQWVRAGSGDQFDIGPGDPMLPILNEYAL
jgi:mannan endo-1,4-beta-mannosidase